LTYAANARLAATPVAIENVEHSSDKITRNFQRRGLDDGDSCEAGFAPRP
jgi:hypothetical protein